MITISSGLCQATINPLGAELTSLISTRCGTEFMWSGDAAYWVGRAPVLFPIVGELRNGQMQARNRSWKINRHGFVRKRDFVCKKISDNQVDCSIESDSDTLSAYPWRFRLTISFTVIADELFVDYAIVNLDDDALYFNLGSHPAFALPLEKARLEDFRIRFDKAESLQRFWLEDNLLLAEPEPLALEDQAIRITRTLFDRDALVFMNINSSELSLEYAPIGSNLAVSRVRVGTGGAPHLGIWSKPRAPYVCIEPWWGYADFQNGVGDFSQKPSIQKLASGKIFRHQLCIKTFDSGSTIE